MAWEGAWADATTYVTANSPAECSSSLVTHEGSTYICTADHTADSTTEPGVGVDWETVWNLFSSGTSGDFVTWRGIWADATDYEIDDFVTLDGVSYMCTTAHTSTEELQPDPGDDYEGGDNWIVVALGNGEEEAGFLGNLLDGVFDWVKDIGNWGLGDFLTALAAGAGLVWAGSKLVDFFEVDPVGDGNANAAFEGGTALYAGAFTTPTVPEVVTDICAKAGITDIDISGLTADPVNFAIADTVSARNLLEALSRTFFFDMFDSGSTLKFVSRSGQTPVRTLTLNEDIGFSSGVLQPPITTKRYQGVDLPRSVSVSYFNEDIAHNTYIQTATLETFTEGQDIDLSIPATITDAQALSIAEKTLVNSHVERNTYAFTTSFAHLDLEPGDIVTVESIGAVRILRIEEADGGALLKFLTTSAAIYDSSYIDSGLTPEPPPAYTDAPITISYSGGMVLELPPLESNDSAMRLTVVPTGFGVSGWPGCSIFVSADGGSTYSLYANTTKESTWGKVAVATADAPDNNALAFDESTTIRVELRTGSLSSVSEIDVLNGQNWAFIGDEVIGFKTATLVSGTTYDLTGLLRGRRGTEVFMDTHVADEQFVLLDDALVDYTYGPANAQTSYLFKFVTNGSTLAGATAYPGQPNTKSRRPWRVANFAAAQTGTDWNLSWKARNHFDSEMVDSSTVQKPEGFAGFVIQILDTGTDAVVRTITQQVDTYNYTTAQQTTDFGSAQSTIKVRISQIDLTVGPGYQTTTEFTA